MKIGKKLFLSLLILSLASLILSTGIGRYQLVRTREDINDAQYSQTKELTDTNISVMTEFNASMITALAQNYSEGLGGKFNAVANQVLSLQNYLRDVYENGVETVSRFPDDMYYLQPGVSYDDIAEEFQITKSVRDLMAAMMEADANIAVYYVSESGLLLADRYADYSSGGYVDRRTRDWYIGAINERDLFWVPVYKDLVTDKMTITCSVAVTSKSGEVLGVVGCDITIDSLIDSILNIDSEIIEYTFLMDSENEDFVGSIQDVTLEDYIGDAKRRDDLIKEILGASGVGLYDDGKVMAGYASIPITGWWVGAIIDYQKIIAPARNMEDAITRSNAEFIEYLDGRIHGAIRISIIAAVVLILFVLFISDRVSRSITKPLAALTYGVDKVSEGNLDYSIEIKSGDEIEQLAVAFNEMTRRLREHIENLAKITAEKERIATELNVATKIQADMLPNVFPAFPEHKEFEIFATMQPAKEVGGDFYDFFLIDNDHLGIVMADVSGKGVPAALFMVIAKTLINTRARTAELPKDVFTNVNNQLCEGNEASLFVTAWMGILEISTGKMTYVNAGHNYPLIKRADGSFEYLKSIKGFVLAGMEGIKYKQQEFQMNKGDTLYLYTDGVTEAHNTNGELYGENRLQNMLNTISDLSLTEILHNVKVDIDKFAYGAPQFDDITMLCLRLKE